MTRRKNFKPRRERKMGLIPAALVMKPMDDLLDNLLNGGYITVDDNGVPTTFDYSTEECYHTLPAARGFVEFFQIWERRHRRNLILGPLVSLLNDIEAGNTIKPEWIKEAQQAVNRMRKTLMSMTVAEASDLTKTAQIMFEFDEQKAEAKERNK